MVPLKWYHISFEIVTYSALSVNMAECTATPQEQDMFIAKKLKWSLIII
ncbi:hypothetical protein ATPR_2248 [Acetobacter tropicalis NBRC 101654]|uniref:Uncharacterized protein n=1 Tax=Acetobacter tropicalis NBRC 101654 TaxID=749388 RepID=F7VFU9_9PROT|nr:hypothetical protein ATPR_2248 [Acetobacter tropicalis NBRC 101654]